MKSSIKLLPKAAFIFIIPVNLLQANTDMGMSVSQEVKTVCCDPLGILPSICD